MSLDPVMVEDHGPVRTITLNRPAKRNAVDLAIARGISDAVDGLETRDDLLVGVLTGAGGTFCAGMDLQAFADGENPVLEVGGFAGLVTRERSKVMIAAVEGWALAGGFELALACDLMVVGEDARFGLPEVRRGLVASSGGLLRLPRRIPPAVAMEYALTGDHFSAPEAHRLGLTNNVVAPGGALRAARELAWPIQLPTAKAIPSCWSTSPVTSSTVSCKESATASMTSQLANGGASSSTTISTPSAR